jgi:hypothetical protein
VARQCFDLTASERLRNMASEFLAKAEEIEDEEEQTFPTAMMGRNGSSNSETDRE